MSDENGAVKPAGQAAAAPQDLPGAGAGAGAGAGGAQPAGQPSGPTKVVWDDSAMATSFANVVNVLNTKEEFMLLFGQNKTWNLLDAKEMRVDLDNRIVLTPYAAKRLLGILQARVAEYERLIHKIDL